MSNWSKTFFEFLFIYYFWRSCKIGLLAARSGFLRPNLLKPLLDGFCIYIFGGGGEVYIHRRVLYILPYAFVGCGIVHSLTLIALSCTDQQLCQYLVHGALHFHCGNECPRNAVGACGNRWLVEKRAVLGYWRCICPSICPLPGSPKSTCWCQH